MGKHFAHASSEGYCVLRQPLGVRVEQFVPWHLEGDGALVYPFKAFAERVATE